ncbi:MAG TPA: hypothetical protein VMZ00_09030 [Sporichthya sp.]|nr:hypothetical protein [Sporichthya sp.]
MRPDARVWRKAARAALKGIRRGRRTTHQVETQEPSPGSSWKRRHPGAFSLPLGFTRRHDSEATQQEADAWLDTMRPRAHPYQQFPARPDVHDLDRQDDR